jgi:hypothetical protein
LRSIALWITLPWLRFFNVEPEHDEEGRPAKSARTILEQHHAARRSAAWMMTAAAPVTRRQT